MLSLAAAAARPVNMLIASAVGGGGSAMQNHKDPVSNVDWVMAIASLLFFIGSFLPLATVSASFGFGKVSASVDSWHSYGVAGMLIGLAGIALWVVARFGLVTLPPGRNWPLIAGGAILLGTVLVFLRGVVYSGDSTSVEGHVVASASLGYGAFIVLIAGIVAASCATFRARVDLLATRAVGSARVASQNAQRARAERQRSAAANRPADGPAAEPPASTAGEPPQGEPPRSEPPQDL